MIKVQGLTKYYGSKPAAKDITFEVQKGEVFGLLGTNGAGKSTTIKMLCGLLKPTRGLIKIGDIDLNRTPLKAKALMGYLPENPLIYDKLTGAETLELIGKLRKLSNELIEQRVKYYAETLGLGEQINLRPWVAISEETTFTIERYNVITIATLQENFREGYGRMVETIYLNPPDWDGPMTEEELQSSEDLDTLAELAEAMLKNKIH